MAAAPRKIILLAFAVLTILASLAHPWDGKKDNKSIAELELMNDRELFMEIHSACTAAAFRGPIYGPGFIVQAIEYAQTIERVARKKHGGKSPAWASKTLLATTEADKEKCKQAVDLYVAELKKRKNPGKP